MNVSKNATLPHKIECEESLSLSSNEGIFQPPLRENLQFFQPFLGRTSKLFDPSHLTTTPYCWVENDQPLECRFQFYTPERLETWPMSRYG